MASPARRGVGPVLTSPTPMFKSAAAPREKGNRKCQRKQKNIFEIDTADDMPQHIYLHELESRISTGIQEM
jgi:hypothetical protein